MPTTRSKEDLSFSDCAANDRNSIRIRPATPEEADVLSGIAREAKQHWGYPEHWIRHWHADLTVSPDFITQNEVYVAEREGKVLGFYALVVRADKAKKAELEHMWVAPAHIGAGIGKELFVHAMQKAAGENISTVEISSDPNAEGFYQKMGAQRIGEVTSEIDGQQRVLPLLTIDPKA